eukprot:14400816-Alexandrium_andersonii.AAC.1
MHHEEPPAAPAQLIQVLDGKHMARALNAFQQRQGIRSMQQDARDQNSAARPSPFDEDACVQQLQRFWRPLLPD